MKTEDLIKKVLYLYNSFVFFIDSEQKICKEVYYEENKIGENLSFIDLAHLMAKSYNLKDIFYDKIDRFMTNLDTDSGTFTPNNNE